MYAMFLDRTRIS